VGRSTSITRFLAVLRAYASTDVFRRLHADIARQAAGSGFFNEILPIDPRGRAVDDLAVTEPATLCTASYGTGGSPDAGRVVIAIERSLMAELAQEVTRSRMILQIPRH
jgi:hypothetical protein